MKQVTATVTANSKVMPETHLIWLESPELASQAKPGQFVMVRCGTETILPRPLSIHQRDRDKIALLFNIVGIGTEWLSQCKVGESVMLIGPLGNDFIVQSGSQNLLLIAGGMGIAPLRFLAQEILNTKRAITLIYGTADDKRYSVSEDIELVSATEDGSAGHRGMATDLLPEYIDWADQIFACGPVGMYQTIAGMPELRNKSVQVSMEVRMGCGRGMCYGCTIRTRKGLKRVCQDGPVFNLHDILWDEIKL